MTPSSQIETNKEIARRFFELVSQANIEDLCSLVSADWTMHGGLPGLPPGRDGVRKLFGSFGNIEQLWIVNDVIAEDNKVAVRATNTCRQESFFGIPGKGKTQIFTATFIHKIHNGEITETWRNGDDLGRLLQLGARLEPAKDN